MTDENETRELPGVTAKPHRTVSRVTTILEFVAARGGAVRLNDIARVLDSPKSSVHGLVQGLIATGYLTSVDGDLSPGPAIEMLATASRPRQIVPDAHRELQALSRETDETAMLGIRVGGSTFYIDTVASEQLLRFVPALREPRPMFVTALGKIFLAEVSDAELQRLHKTSPIPPVGGLGQLRAELEDVRRTGIAYNHSESVPGLCAVAAGVREPDGTLIAGVTVAGPSARVEPRLAELGERVADTAAAVSAKIAVTSAGSAS